jgi:hypothetical protein
MVDPFHTLFALLCLSYIFSGLFGDLYDENIFLILVQPDPYNTRDHLVTGSEQNITNYFVSVFAVYFIEWYKPYYLDCHGQQGRLPRIEFLCKIRKSSTI